MLYIVEFRREHEPLAKIMSAFEYRLDAQHFEPDAFRCKAEEDVITCSVGFKVESEARACAEVFGGQLSSPDEFFS